MLSNAGQHTDDVEDAVRVMHHNPRSRLDKPADGLKHIHGLKTELPPGRRAQPNHHFRRPRRTPLGVHRARQTRDEPGTSWAFWSMASRSSPNTTTTWARAPDDLLHPFRQGRSSVENEAPGIFSSVSRTVALRLFGGGPSQRLEST